MVYILPIGWLYATYHHFTRTWKLRWSKDPASPLDIQSYLLRFGVLGKFLELQIPSCQGMITTIGVDQDKHWSTIDYFRQTWTSNCYGCVPAFLDIRSYQPQWKVCGKVTKSTSSMTGQAGLLISPPKRSHFNFSEKWTTKTRIYCWWKKSGQPVDMVVFPITYRVFKNPFGGFLAGFLNHQQ